MSVNRLAISGDRNVIIKKEAEESLKHKDFTTEVQCMWNIMSDTGTSGTISQLFRECLNEIPGKRDFSKVQKAAILGIACILEKVRM